MRILLVEDDKSLSMAVSYRLKKEGFEVETCFDGPSALEQAQEKRFDLILLDRMLPGMSGDEILKYLRVPGQEAKVLMLTAMDGIEDRVGGLDAGADDYLVKPFAMDELMARIRALSRRPSTWMPEGDLCVADARLDCARLTLKCGNRTQTLTKREAKLLEFLMRNANQILPRGVVFERVWDDSIVEEGNLDIYIHFLRKHLAGVKSQVKIETMRGIGYRLSGGGKHA